MREVAWFALSQCGTLICIPDFNGARLKPTVIGSESKYASVAFLQFKLKEYFGMSINIFFNCCGTKRCSIRNRGRISNGQSGPKESGPFYHCLNDPRGCGNKTLICLSNPWGFENKTLRCLSYSFRF